MAVREAEPVGSLSEVREAGLDREDLLGIYRNLLVTRGIEERGHILYKQGKIPGSFYTGRGNEGAAVGVATAMGPNDVGTPLHRDMGVHVTRGVEPWRIFAQYMGRDGGITLQGARHEDRPELPTHPTLLEAGEIGLRRGHRLRDVKRLEVVAALLPRRPRQVVVTVDERVLGEQCASAPEGAAGGLGGGGRGACWHVRH